MDNSITDRLSISFLFIIQLIGFLIYIIRLMVLPYEMTIGVFNSISVWITISLIPIIIPIIFDNKILKWIILIIGIIITLINIMLPMLTIIDNSMKEPLIWAALMIIICGFSGLIGNIKIIKWIKN